MRKFLAMVLVVVLCGCTQNTTPNPSSRLTEQTEIRLVCTQNSEQLEKVITAFEKENPEIAVTVVEIDESDNFALAAKALFSGNNYPALVLTEAEYLNGLSQHLADLSAETWINTAVPNSLNEVVGQNGIIAVPAEIEGIGFVYNKVVFERAGINPENVNSLDRLISTAEYLSEKIPELRDEFENLTAVFEAPDEKTGEYLLNIVVSQECASSVELVKTDIEMTFAESYRILFDLQQYYSRKTSNSTEQNMEEVRYIITLQSHKITDGSAELSQDLGVLPVSVLGASQDSIILNVPSFWAINKNATRQEQTAAKKLLFWLYNSETGTKLLAEELRWLSPFNNSVKIPDNPLAEKIKIYAVSGKTMPHVLSGVGEEKRRQIKDQLDAIIEQTELNSVTPKD